MAISGKTAQVDQQGQKAPPAPLSPALCTQFHPFLQLQSSIGNQATEHLLRSHLLQRKLRISQPHDICEQEADLVADQVMRMPNPLLQRTSAPRAEGEMPCPKSIGDEGMVGAVALPPEIKPMIQRQATEEPEEEQETQLAKEVVGEAPALSESVEGHIDDMRSGGEPLPASLRAFFEPRFAHKFSEVKIHADAKAAESARAVNALAYTVGSDLAFAPGQYFPATTEGRRLLAHELTHVLQQSGGDGLGIQRKEPPKEEPVEASTTTESTPTTTTTSTTAPTETATPVATDPAKPSGKTWWDANEKIDPLGKKSSDIADLESDFQGKVKEFKKALDDAGTSISIDTTKRPEERAHVLHYAWEVAKGNIKASAVPAMAGVDIEWDHGNDTKSEAGAQEIITAANVRSKPSLTSNHIAGKAIDWTITWPADLKIKKKDGTEVVIKSTPRNGGDPGNTELHEVGKGYGVIKGIFTIKDPPHWSFDGK